MNWMTTVTLITGSVAVLWGGFDAHISQKGFAAGGFEGDPLASRLFGIKPSFWQLMIANGIYQAAFILPALIWRDNVALNGLAMGGSVAYVIGAELAILKWEKWLKS